MGAGGGLYVSYTAFVSPQDVLPILTFQIWAMLIVGGAGNNRGAIMGAFLIWGLFPLYFKALQSVPAMEIIVHRVLWSALFGGLFIGLFDNNNATVPYRTGVFLYRTI